MVERKESFETLEVKGLEVEVVEFDEKLADITMEKYKNDKDFEVEYGKGEDK